MKPQSLGLIETVGLTAAFEAADAAVKSANVLLLGYEITKGGGFVVVKVAGEVGAVNAAVEAASFAVAKVGKVYATKVIARAAKELELLIPALKQDEAPSKSITIKEIEVSDVQNGLGCSDIGSQVTETVENKPSTSRRRTATSETKAKSE
ncbi:BMC domain-containing protein [Testudinibacter sp. P27/CKL/0425]